MIKSTNGQGEAYQYEYDLAGRLIKVIDPSGVETVYTYDKAGRKITMRDGRSKITTYGYYECGIAKSITNAELLAETYKYDLACNAVEITDKNGIKLTHEYNNKNQLLSKYIADTSDHSNRLKTVTSSSKTATYDYDENGNRSSLTYPGGVKEEYTYNKNNKLLVVNNKKADGTLISSYSNAYDLAGRIISKTVGSGVTNYTYDVVGRIIKSEDTDKRTEYLYDHASNRSIMTETYTSEQTFGADRYICKTSHYQYSDANKLSLINEIMKDAQGVEVLRKESLFNYDNNDNETRKTISVTKSGQELTAYHLLETSIFDGFNRLKERKLEKANLTTTVNFLYNGSGLRTRKTYKSSENNNIEEVTNYYYDRGHVILETDASDTIKNRYTRGINYVSRTDGQGNISYMLYNGHGDVVQSVLENGTIENRYAYDIFGGMTQEEESKPLAIRYAGEFYDKESELYYLRARYYNPTTARFISEDTYLGEENSPLSLNLYTYCYNNPLSFVDPSGHVVTKWDMDHLSRNDCNEIENQTSNWNRAHAAGDKEGMAASHKAAAAIRKSKLSSNEAQRDDGHSRS